MIQTTRKQTTSDSDSTFGSRLSAISGAVDGEPTMPVGSQPNPMADIRSALVIVSASLLKPVKPETSLIFQRAADMQKRTGCEVNLLHVANVESGTDYLRELMALRTLARRAEKRHGGQFGTRFLARQDRSEAILEEVRDTPVDLVMKASAPDGVPAVVETDTSLLEQSPVPIWFTRQAQAIDDIAVTCDGSGNQDGLTISLARQVGSAFDATVKIVDDVETMQSDMLITRLPNEDEAGAPAGAEAVDSAITFLQRQNDCDLFVHRGSDWTAMPHAA